MVSGPEEGGGVTVFGYERDNLEGKAGFLSVWGRRKEWDGHRGGGGCAGGKKRGEKRGYLLLRRRERKKKKEKKIWSPRKGKRERASFSRRGNRN